MGVEDFVDAEMEPDLNRITSAVTSAVIGAAIAVHKALGARRSESI